MRIIFKSKTDFFISSAEYVNVKNTFKLYFGINWIEIDMSTDSLIIVSPPPNDKEIVIPELTGSYVAVDLINKWLKQIKSEMNDSKKISATQIVCDVR